MAVYAGAVAALVAAIVGAGFIGVEVAASLASRGLEATVIAPESVPLEQKVAAKVYQECAVPIGSEAERVRHVVQSAFNGRRIVIFSGGAAKSDDAMVEEARAIREGGGFGSIIGRNSFERPRPEALELLSGVIKTYAVRAASRGTASAGSPRRGHRRGGPEKRGPGTESRRRRHCQPRPEPPGSSAAICLLGEDRRGSQRRSPRDHRAGRIFWFTRKKFSGSYFVLTSTSRA
jgi:hypothetical protein